MNIVVDINHPAHVHYFKYFINEMISKKHNVLVTASNKEITFRLLENYQIDYIDVGNYGSSLIKKIINVPIMDLRYYLSVKKFKPDILVGFGSIRAAHASFLLNKPCINFTDTEHSIEQLRLYLPFVKAVLTPSCFQTDLGKKHFKFDSYMEMASLYPNRFTPNPEVLSEIGLTPGDRFIIVRFVSWEASHDVGQHGIRNKIGLVKALEQYGRVLITSEGELPEELVPYKISVSPEKLHDLLYYSTLYVGEGATTASECAMLGTHAVYVNTLRAGTIAEQSDKYHLISDFSRRVCNDETVLAEAEKLLQNKNLKSDGKMKRMRIVEDKGDLTAMMIWLFDNYPQSFSQLKSNPRLQNQFNYSGKCNDS